MGKCKYLKVRKILIHMVFLKYEIPNSSKHEKFEETMSSYFYQLR